MDPQTRVLVVGDSHIRRLRDFVEAPPDEFQGFVQLSMGLVDSSKLDLSFLGRGGRTVGTIEIEDMQEIERFAPHVVILMVGGNDLTSPTASPLGVASGIHDLALSIAAVPSCVKVLVGAIPPRRSYPSTVPAYPGRVDRCNFILRNLCCTVTIYSCIYPIVYYVFYGRHCLEQLCLETCLVTSRK